MMTPVTDAVITTIKKLEIAKVSAPEELTALLRWVRAGGTLIVNDLGQDYSDLHELDRARANVEADALFRHQLLAPRSNERVRDWVIPLNSAEFMNSRANCT